MKRIIFTIFFLLLILNLIGAECNVTLPPGITPTETATPTPTSTPCIGCVTPPTGFTVFGYEDPSGNDPVADGYINAEEKTTGFKAYGIAPQGSTVEMQIIYKGIYTVSTSRITVGTSGNWNIEITQDKWGEDGFYKMVFKNSEYPDTNIEKEIALDTEPPRITSSAGYASSIRDYDLTITQEAEHISCMVDDAGELVSSSWEVYVKAGSGIVIEQDGDQVDTLNFQQGDVTKIKVIPGVLVIVDNSISHDETLRFTTEAPTWGPGFFSINFSEEVKSSTIPLESLSISNTTMPVNSCTITLTYAGDTYAALYIVGGAEAVFNTPGASYTQFVRYEAPSGATENKVGWTYNIRITNIEDKAGNKATVESTGTMEKYSIWR